VRPRDQASKSKIQGERPFVEQGDHSSSKETIHRETRLFVEGGRRVFVAGEGVHCGRGCALQERAFIAGEGIHRRRGYSSQEGGGLLQIFSLRYGQTVGYSQTLTHS